MRELAERRKIDVNAKGVFSWIQELTMKGVIFKSESNALKDMIVTLNRAAHGLEVDSRTAQWVLEVGPKVLNSINLKY